MTVHKAKKLTKHFLEENNLEYTKLTGRTVDFVDLARGSGIFVKIHGWKPDPRFQDLKTFAKKHGFFVETDGLG